jgi:hypothetical protein
MEKSELIDHVLANSTNAAVLDRLPATGLPDAWLVAGSLFQATWNGLTGRAPTYGIKDYDIVYFDDSDLSWEAEDRAIRAAAAAFVDLDATVEIRNQARVHLWYPEKFGMPYAALSAATAGIDRYLAVACMIGLQPQPGGDLRLYAPRGLDDVSRLIVRPNDSPNFNAANYHAKAARWQQAWPELTVRSAQ